LVQSGAMAGVLAARGQGEFGIDFSYIVTFGNAADLTPAELIDFLADDPHTTVIAVYLEGVTDGRALMKAALRALDAGKPVVVLRSGLSMSGSAAVQSHTASMTGDREVFEAACRQSGICLSASSEEFLQALSLFRTGRRSAVNGVGFASISGAACALFADHAERAVLPIAPLAADTLEAMRRCLPVFLKPGNPLDLGPVVFDDAAYAQALRAFLSEDSVDVLIAYLFTSVPEQVNSPAKIALLEELARETGKPLIAIWEAALPEERAALMRLGSVAVFTDIRCAVDALARLRAWSGARKRHHATLGQAATEVVIKREKLTLPGRPGPLSEYEGKRVLRVAGITVPEGVLVQSADEAMRTAADIGFPIAIKIQSAAIAHKTEVGGVCLGIDSPQGAVAAWSKVIQAARAGAGDAPFDGVLVEAMVGGAGVEMIVAAHRDPQFGPIVTVGAGGTAVELQQDIARYVGKPAPEDVRAMLSSLRMAKRLTGFRADAGYDVEALVDLIVRLGAFFFDEDRIREIELNPVKVLRPEKGAVALDCLMTLG